ncbi:MAG: AIR synthase-related protein [Syntrophorhabdales bacterium]
MASENLRRNIEGLLRTRIDALERRKVYTIDASLTKKELSLLTKELFVDPIAERTLSDKDVDGFDWLIEVGYKPGVTDNVGKTARNVAIPNIVNRELGEREGVYTSMQYLIGGKHLSREEIVRIGTGLLANPVVETIKVIACSEIKTNGIAIELPVIRTERQIEVKSYDLNAGDGRLAEISRNGGLSLSLEEMKGISEYFTREGVMAERKKVGMEKQFWGSPSDVEIEAIAQTWSEHCKHKIFNAKISYRDGETGKGEEIDGLFNTYIKTPSNKIASELGWVASSFHDNAGVVRFNERVFVVDKVETHNAPSALDPYGGAITGIVGVNRDVMGTGMGAKLMFNVFGYSFGSPLYSGELPEGVLHPRRIRDGVHKGVIDGGNQSGIPLAGSWEFFDERFAFRPLVFCGSIGVMNREINGEPSEVKKASPGDVIVMVGGRIGKDGIHGATFSSAELSKDSPVQAVQIGDPITQKKMADFLLEARDLGLYTCITDNGAGGLSSSVGEMARYTNGCSLDLKKAPLKYQGLDPWEILLSEAQERMTLAVAPGKLDAFLKLAKGRDVEATPLGTFERSGRFHVTYGDKTVAHLDMRFLHEGVPRMELRAEWKKELYEEPKFEAPVDMNKTLKEMLSRLNICSKETKLRQYDHEVKGLSVVKPLVGKERDVPSDATVSFLEYGSKEGLIAASGANPHYSDIDTYHMAASAVDEAVRRIIAVGGKMPSKKNVLYGLDNFCWNLSELDDEDGRFKLAQLVRANKALADYCEAFGVPCVSGKDSMKNVWKMKEVVEGKEVEKTVSIPPTLLFSARAKIDDVGKAITMDVKRPGDLVYVVGKSYDELGGSEYYAYMGEKLRGERYVGNNVPKVDAESAKRTYENLSKAAEIGLVHSIHTPTIGGLGVALAQTAFAGGHGIVIDLQDVPYEGEKRDDRVLFSESNSRFVVTIPPEKKDAFERMMEGTACSCVGFVVLDPRLVVWSGGVRIIDSEIESLKEAWKSTLREM